MLFCPDLVRGILIAKIGSNDKAVPRSYAAIILEVTIRHAKKAMLKALILSPSDSFMSHLKKRSREL